MTSKVAQSTRSQSTANSIEVLDLIASQPGITLADLTRKTGLSKSAVHRLLHTLADAGYVRDDVRLGGYVLGYRIVVLGRAAAEMNTLGEVALEPMRSLRDEVNETVHLAVVEGETAIYVEKVESTRALRHWTRLGEPLPLHCGAAAKCLAAFAFNAEALERLMPADGVLPAYTERTCTDVDTFLAELEQIRSSGVAGSSGEQYDGVTGLSVPIFASGRRCVGALSLAGPSTRFTDDAIVTWTERLRAVADEIEQQL